MDTRFNGLLTRLGKNPENDILWLQVKRQIKQNPEQCCCVMFFDQLGKPGSTIQAILIERGIEILPEILQFYRSFIEKTQVYGDVWGGEDFWQIVQFLEVWSIEISHELPTARAKQLAQIQKEVHSIISARAMSGELNSLKLPFLAHEVAWNLAMYLTPAPKLADYPQFAHVYFLPTELIPLAFDLENYNLSPFNERYLETLLHDTRKSAIKAALLNFAQTFPLVLQAKWAYAIYISLEQGQWSKHPFIRRLLANSYWEARLNGELVSFNVKNKYKSKL